MSAPMKRRSSHNSQIPIPIEELLAKMPEIPKKPKQKITVLVMKSVLYRADIFRKILLLTDGRDKLMKVAQYTAKILLWKIALEKSETQDKLKALTSNFSIVRKVIRLAHFMEPFNEIQHILKEKDFNSLAGKLAPLNAVLGICNDLCDDVICLSKIGLMDKKWAEKLTPYSDRLWYMTIFIDIHANFVATSQLIERRSMERSPELAKQISNKIFMSNVSLFKLIADFVFCTIDVFNMGDRVSSGYQNLTGWSSAVLGTYKLYVKSK